MRIPEAAEKRFLTWETCPVVSSYLKQLSTELPADNFMYGDTVNELQQIANDHPNSSAGNRSTQMFRAFYCLSAMSENMIQVIGVDNPRFDYTWEGLTKYLGVLHELDKKLTVNSVLNAFAERNKKAAPNGSPFGPDPVDPKAPLNASINRLQASRNEKHMQRITLVIDAAEFLRPKLRNGECVGKMGSKLALGLLASNVTTDTYKKCLRQLLNIHRQPHDWHAGA